jgi:hypothetical protein
MTLGEAASPSFPPLDRAVVVSIACDVVARTGNPLSRQSTTDLAKRAAEELNRPIGRTTVWQILDEDAVKPWQYEHWLFPRAADFFDKAAVVLDLYQGYYQDEQLDPFDRVISSDEKTSIQARVREDPTLAPGPGRCRRVAAKYKRGGAQRRGAGHPFVEVLAWYGSPLFGFPEPGPHAWPPNGRSSGTPSGRVWKPSKSASPSARFRA